jgi:Zn-dependent protease
LILSGLPPLFAAKPVPFNPSRVRYDEYGAAMIGIAGPLSNLLLACFAAAILRFGILSGSLANIAAIFIVINISFFVFNMIPIPPLDGSRLLYAFAPEPLQRIMFQIESFGFFAILIIFIFLAPILGPGISRAVEVLTHILVGSGFSI